MRQRPNISVVFNSILLIILLISGNSAIAQSGLSSPVKYQARDSIVADLKNQSVKLYGAAWVQYEDIEVDADVIEIDLDNSEVSASFTLDSLGNPIGRPVFKSAGEESRCDYLKYNFKTKEGYIKEVRTQQGGGYVHMAEGKYHPNEQIHLKDGKFTTCENDTPHYHFKLTKAVIIPDERIVTGPVYMKLFKIPTPLAAPFAFFPNSDSRKHGLIIPSFANTPTYGFGLQNIGYYIPLGDYWDTRFYGTIFTSGRFGLENSTSYYRKYKYKGDFGIKFEQFRGRFYDTTLTNKWTIRWRHTQDAKAHPSLTFSTDINFKSDNNGKSSLEAVNAEYFDNQFNSAVNVSKRWRTRQFSGTAGLKTSLQQNSVSQNYVIELPSFNFTVARFDLGVLRRSKIGSSPLDKIYVNYTMNARNTINAPDSIFNADDLFLVSDYALNGVHHNASVRTNMPILRGRFVFTPSINYNEYWNFQYVEQDWNYSDSLVDVINHRGFKSAREVSFTGNIVTNFFGYYKFKGKKKTRFRHVASPSASFSYRPDIPGFYQSYDIDTGLVTNTIYYSPFANSLYGGPNRGESGVISFSLTNTLEMKTRDMKDTLNESTKTFKLVDQASLSGNYDIFRDSMNLSAISLAFRTARFFKIFSFQSSASLFPYGWVDSSGVDIKEYAWNNGQGIGRIKTANGALNANFTNATGRKKQKELGDKYKDDANATGAVTDPNMKSFEIPWQLNLSYNVNYTRLSLYDDFFVLTDSFRLVQTIKADGDFNFNDKWKFGYIINYDLQAGAFTNYNLSLWRDLHCWEATLQFGQYGKIIKDPNTGKWVGPDPNNPGEKIKYWQQTNFTFLFRVNIKASMFQDIKLEYRQPPFFF